MPQIVSKILGGYSLLNKLFFTLLILGALGWYYFDAIATFLVDDARVKNTVTKSLSEATGKEVSIDGEVQFTTEPEPFVSVHNVIIAGDAGNVSENFSEIGEISTKPALGALLRGKIDFDELIIKNSVINLESKNGENNVIYDLSKKVFSSETDYGGKKIIFKNLEINFYKPSPIENSKPFIHRKIILEELTLDPKPQEGGYTIKGSVYSESINETYVFSINFARGLGSDSDFSARLYSSDAEINFTGKANTSSGIDLSGEISGKVSAFSYKLLNLIGFSDDVTEVVQMDEKAEISGQVYLNGKGFGLKNIKVESDVLKLGANIITEVSGNKYNSDINIRVTELNYKNLLKNRKEQIAIHKAKIVETDFNKRLEGFYLFSTGDDINYNFNLNIDKITFFGYEAGNLEIKANQNNNLFTLNKFQLVLPGNSAFENITKIQIDKKNLTMDGEIVFALYGESLDRLSYALGIVENIETSPGLDSYFLKTKGYLQGKKVHFKKIIAKVNDNRFAGQMLIDYEKQFQASSAFNFDKLELDRYLPQDQKETYQNNFAQKIDFLRIVDSVFDELKISLTSANLTKSAENLSDFTLYAQINPGITKITGLYFKTQKLGEVRVNATIDINDFQPIVDINLKIDKYDFDNLEYGNPVAENDVYNFRGDWDKSKISFDRLGYMEGKMKIAVDNLKFRHFNLENFRTALDLNGSKVEVKDSKFEIFGTKIDFSGWMTTEYPSFGISFVSAGLDMKNILGNLLGVDEIEGKFNVSGVVTSTGYSTEELARAIKGRIQIITNGFKIRGFDLAGLSQNLPEAKKIEQAKEIGLPYLNSGETVFDGLNTSFNINEGKIFIDNLELSSREASRGVKSNGEINLLDWRVDINTDLGVTTMDGLNIDLALKTKGKMPDQELIWNEEVLSKYWEEKFYSGR